MCGRFTYATAPEITAEFFELTSVPELKPRYNIAPTQPVPVILVSAEDSCRKLRPLHWGLIPHWAKDPGIGARMINARAETVATKPAFRAAFRERRCLIAADGFYEWQKLPRGKQPFYIRLSNAEPFAFAGLWEHWEGPDGAGIGSCTILTTEPNEVLRPIHNRMPVILHPKDFSKWLDRATKQTNALEALLRPYPTEAMTAYPVSTRVNSPTRDDAGCIEHI